jgi:Tol biopolymer transport system component/heme/copper-type cytochrome/quinol oxidase subunit 2
MNHLFLFYTISGIALSIFSYPLNLNNTHWQTASLIVFASERTGNREIYTMSSNGDNPQQLTNNPAEDISPVWSPDRRQIAFVSNRDEDFALYIMDADGGNPYRVTDESVSFVANPTWSPDGRSIAFESVGERDPAIFVVNLSGGDAQQVSRSNSESTEPDWSPDGSRIAYTGLDDNSVFQIFTMSPNGGNSTQLSIDREGDVRLPRWSPDGQYLAFVNEAGARSELAVLEFSTSEIMEITTIDRAFITDMAWSPDGSELAFVYYEPGGVTSIRRVGFEDTIVTVLTDGSVVDGWVAWGGPSASVSVVASAPTTSAFTDNDYLNYNSYIDYDVTLTAGQTLTASMVSNDFDTYLYLLDANGRELMRDDDGGSDVNSLLTYSANSAGTYYIRAYSYNGNGAGDFSLDISITGGGTSSPSSSTLTDGDSVNDYLDYNTYTDYAVSLTAGQTLTASMVSNDFDTYLYLLDANDRQIAYDDDGGSDVNSLLTYSANSAGTYYVRAYSYNGNGAGDFSLDISITGGGTSPSSSSSLTDGDSVNDYLDYNTYTDYAVSLTAGQTLTVNMRSNNFDTYLYLLDANGREIAYNDDGGTDTNSLLTYTANAAGTYYIRAYSYVGNGSGNFSLDVTIGGSTGSIIGTRQLQNDQSVNDSLNVSEYIDYTLSLSTSQRVTVSLVSNDFDTYLSVYDPSGREVGRDDDGGSGTNSTLEFIANSSGDYTIRVSSFGGYGGGRFSVQASVRNSVSSNNNRSSNIDTSNASGVCGRTVRFAVGDEAIVDFNRTGALRIVTDPDGSVQTTLAQAYDDNRLVIQDLPVCYDDIQYYWIFYPYANVYGWVAETDTNLDPYLCTPSQPECRRYGS